MGMWQPDGWARTRIGVLTPHADVGPESEFGAMAPDGISIHAARVPFGAYKPGGAMDPTIADDPDPALFPFIINQITDETKMKNFCAGTGLFALFMLAAWLFSG